MQQTTAAPGGQPAATPDARRLWLRVLNDVRDGKISRLPNGVFTVADNTHVADHEQPAYLAELRHLLAEMWVMEWRGVYRQDRDGIGVRLRLSTIGEVRRDQLEQSLAVTR